MDFLLSNPYLAAAIVLAVVVILLLFIVIRLHFKVRRFLVDVNARNIAESLSAVSTDLGKLVKFREEMENYLTTVERRLRKSVQAVETVRFNPFKGTGDGGNQSFATAFLNEEGDGVVISSIYARDHARVFSKPVKNHSSEHEMSDEERQVLDAAKGRIK